MDRTPDETGARRPLEDRAVADVMTMDLLTIGSTESVLMAWELMHQARCHHLPVVNRDGHCVGVLNAEAIAATWEAGGPERARKPVTAVLAERPCDTVSPDDRVSRAAQAMLLLDTDHVAVSVPSGRLVGLLTANDLIMALAGVDRAPTGLHTGMPSLYRIEPVLPDQPQPVRAADQRFGHGPMSPG
jgi:CBS domain-containing membrane protein